jgi:hypothetical protein
MKRSLVLSLLTAAAVLVAGTVLAIMLPTEVPVAVAGQVRCLSGRVVTGIWVEASNGGSDWAFWRSQAEDRAAADFTHTLPFGGAYSVHVGCGGSGAHWETASWSSFVRDQTHHFACDDAKASPGHNGVCT